MLLCVEGSKLQGLFPFQNLQVGACCPGLEPSAEGCWDGVRAGLLESISPQGSSEPLSAELSSVTVFSALGGPLGPFCQSLRGTRGSERLRGQPVVTLGSRAGTRIEGPCTSAGCGSKLPSCQAGSLTQRPRPLESVEGRG